MPQYILRGTKHERNIEFSKNKLKITEDAAHALGSKYKNGKKSWLMLLFRYDSFSFHPVKIIAGEGGIITTNSNQYYQKLLALRTHGITRISLILKIQNKLLIKRKKFVVL